jgi:hypothetical protein
MKIITCAVLLFISGGNFSYGQGPACPNPKYKEVELAAYQALVKARADAAKTLSSEIDGIEKTKKEEHLKSNSQYLDSLKKCGGNAECQLHHKDLYDDAVKIIDGFAKKQLVIAQEKEKAANEEAQKDYEEAIKRAKELYHALCLEASGQDGPTVYTGTVCDTKIAFEITGTIAAGPIIYPFKFSPKSDSTGTFSFYTTFGPAVLQGNGTYTIKGINTQTPRIEMLTSSSGTLMGRTSSGSGPAHITLACKGN